MKKEWVEVFFYVVSLIGPVGIHYRALMVGPVVIDGNDGGPSPVHGPGCIFIVALVVIQAHAALQTLQCTLRAPGGEVE